MRGTGISQAQIHAVDVICRSAVSVRSADKPRERSSAGLERLFHVPLRAGVGDDRESLGITGQAVNVVAIAVGQDDTPDGIGVTFLDLRQNLLGGGLGHFGVDYDDFLLADDEAGVRAAAALDDVYAATDRLDGQGVLAICADSTPAKQKAAIKARLRIIDRSLLMGFTLSC